MEFGAAIKSGFKKTFVYEGRASRSEFWWFQLFHILSLIGLVVVCGILMAVVGAVSPTHDGNNPMAAIMGGLVGLVVIGYIFGMIFPLLSLAVRRLHDSDKSGALLLLVFIPLGGLVVLVFYCLAGTNGPNKFGDDPLRPTNLASVF